MAVSKVILNGDTLIDVSVDSVTSDKLLTGYLATRRDGEKILGSYVPLSVELATGSANPSESAQHIVPPSGYDGFEYFDISAISSDYIGSNVPRKNSSNLSVSGAVVSVPSGYYAAEASKTVAAGSATTPTTTITANPNITISANGLITATNNKTLSVTPTVVAGYVSSGIAGTITVDGSNTSLLSTKAATTYVPTTTTQTIASGLYLTGAQTIAGDANLVPANIASGVSIFGVNGTHLGGAQMTALNVTQNGTYTAPSGTGYTPVTVNVLAQTVGNTYFIDYDGTILHTYTNTEAANLSALPSNPTHNGLTALGWNWTLSEILSYISTYSNADIWVGQMYVTSNGNTEVDISITNALLLDLAINLGVNGTLTIDWGDNSSTDSITDTSTSTNHVIQHSYSNIGNYTISCSMSSGNFAFKGDSTNSFIASIDDDSLNTNKVFSSLVKAIRLGNNINTISSYSFNYCKNLETITIPLDVSTFLNHVFLYSSIKSITLPRSSSISSATYLFSDCIDLISISLPGNLSGTIKNYCFNDCYKLKSITLPSSLSGSIEQYSFYLCYALESIVVPNNITLIGAYAFCNCRNLKNVDLSKSKVYRLEGYAFSNCYSLLNISIPNTLTSIYNNAFSNCYSLESVIADKVTTIQSSIFSGCASLKSVSLSYLSNITNLTSIFNACVNLLSVTFSNSVSRLGNSTFSGCLNLSSISSLNYLTTIDGSLFNQCKSLTSFVISDTVTSIGTSAFAYSGLKSINIPNTVTSIAANAFQGCDLLTSIKLPNNLTVINNSLFYNCNSLLSIDIPNTVTSIGTSAFYQCYNLTLITIPEGVTTIGATAFQSCTSLKTIIIPSTVTSIGTNIFYNDTSLISVTVNASTPPTLGATFTVPSTCTIYVPTASLADYLAASGWSTYASQMVGI